MLHYREQTGGFLDSQVTAIAKGKATGFNPRTLMHMMANAMHVQYTTPAFVATGAAPLDYDHLASDDFALMNDNAVIGAIINLTDKSTVQNDSLDFVWESKKSGAVCAVAAEVTGVPVEGIFTFDSVDYEFNPASRSFSDAPPAGDVNIPTYGLLTDSEADLQTAIDRLVAQINARYTVPTEGFKAYARDITQAATMGVSIEANAVGAGSDGEAVTKSGDGMGWLTVATTDNGGLDYHIAPVGGSFTIVTAKDYLIVWHPNDVDSNTLERTVFAPAS